jgi:KDO2-lipid IV(A) lauroyltransferase
MLRHVVIRIGKPLFKLTALALDSPSEATRDRAIDLCAHVQKVVSAKRKRNVEKNLIGIGVEATGETALGIFGNHTRNIVEMFTASRRTADEIREVVTSDGLEVLDDALAAGRGIVLVTVHVGNWEFGALYLGSLGYRLFAVAGVQMNRLLTGALRDVKEQRGITIVNPEHSYRNLFRALGTNGIVALLVDGDIFLEGAEMNFFGRRITLPKGPVRLARKAGSPIVGAYCRNLGAGQHRIHIERIISGAEITEVTDSEALERLYHTAERFIRSNFDQWCIFRDFWGGCH